MYYAKELNKMSDRKFLLYMIEAMYSKHYINPAMWYRYAIIRGKK